MEWTQVTVTVRAEDIDLAGDIAQMVVPYGIYIEDYTGLEEQVQEIAHIDLIDEELLAKDRSKAFVHIYINPDENPSEAVAFLRERYNAEGIEHKIDLVGCEEQDWLNNWRQYFNVLPIGNRLLIRPTWRENYDAGDRKVIDIDPGLAFGTGSHETTRLCLETLENHITENCGYSVLDVGCGSGILSIASVLLGADRAFGVDIDEMAVKTARENSELNGLADKIDIVCGNLTDKVSGQYDIVVANIVADAIIMLSKDVRKFLKPDGVYIMSGIIDTRADEVINEVGKDFEITQIHNQNGWVCLEARGKN